VKIEPFLMERMQSTWEHRVEINLSESGVVPLSVRELVDDGDVDALLGEPLAYVQSNGSEALRLAVAALHPGAGEDHVEITTGCAEANYLAAWQLVEPGDEVVMTLPNYMQTWGLARAFGAEVKPWRLRPDEAAGRWRPDLDELRRLVRPRTRLILLCHPNNPTGSCLTAAELDEIAAVAALHGAWILCDEVYRGAELAGGEESPSMWGRGERVLVTGGLSKAYGLPGLRLGWIVGPPPQIAELWSRHDYTTIAPATLSDRLATLALEPARRRRLLERTRSILRRNLGVITSWLDALGDRLTYLPPQAGAMLYLRYRHAVNSTVLVERLRRDRGVLVVPGDHYGMDGHLRIGYGYGTEKLREGLARIGEELAAIAPD
jgi:hypothetical protein